MNERERSEAIDRVATDWRELNRRAGVDLTHEQARDRVAEAARKGDAKRDNNNR